ncbi:MAG: hypothetical protein KPEEDBHJ_03661 [Anaerolineales bacterium]|nr:hypothetical protein [Anaerolineales bacterium]
MQKFIKIALFLIVILVLLSVIERITRPNVEYLEKSQDITGLINAMYHRNLGVRNDAKEALIRIGTPAVNPLILHLEDENACISCVVKILGEIGDNRAIEPISKILYDEDITNRSFAAKALTNFGEAGVAPLIEAVKVTKQMGYLNEALVTIGEPSVEPVSKLLKHQENFVKDSAIWILQEINDPSSEKAVVAALEDEYLVFRASKMIVSFHNEDTMVLLPYLKKKSTVGVYKALIFYGEPATIAPLLQAIADYGDEEMAEYYLNCGNEELESAATAWAKENGYTILKYTTPLGEGAKWGGEK